MKRITVVFLFCFSALIALTEEKEYEQGLKAFDSKNYIKSLELVKPYAVKGDPIAQFIVGYCYYNKDLEIKNDSIAEHFLLKSAEQKYGRAMGLLSGLYIQKSINNRKFMVDALVWAEIAAAYDPIQRGTTARNLLKTYMSLEELKITEQILKKKKKKFEKINLTKINSAISQKSKEESEKIKIPDNDLGLIEDPYRDWVSRWKNEKFECETFYYTKSIAPSIIDSTISKIANNQIFELSPIYKGSEVESLKISAAEKEYLTKELHKLKSLEWEENLYPYSKRLDTPLEIQNTFNITEKLKTEKEKNMCSIVYTFSKPIFLRDNSLVLFLDQKRYRTNYTQLSFSFYSLENGRWNELAVVYKYYEHR